MEETIVWKDRKRIFFGLPWTFTKYALTEEKLYIETGVLSKREEEVRLYRIMDVTLKRSLWERICGLGTIHCCSADKSAPEFDLLHIKKSHQIKNMLSDMVEEQRDNLRLVAAAAVQLAAHDDAERGAQIVFFQNPCGEHLRLGGRQRQNRTRARKRKQQLGNAVDDAVFKYADVRKAFAVIADRFFAVRRRKPVKPAERFLQRRADEVRQRVAFGLNAEFRKRVLDAARDALLRVGQRPVKVEQNIGRTAREADAPVAAAIACRPPLRRACRRIAVIEDAHVFFLLCVFVWKAARPAAARPICGNEAAADANRHLVEVCAASGIAPA